MMKYRSHVLHRLIQGFVQRRGHDILRRSLGRKNEHVLYIRLTAVQENLYKGVGAVLNLRDPVVFHYGMFGRLALCMCIGSGLIFGFL